LRAGSPSTRAGGGCQILFGYSFQGGFSRFQRPCGGRLPRRRSFAAPGDAAGNTRAGSGR